ncbi:uncharacterized protein [Rutidosis leptorrhynchoides]|uniref:uncharacterized protein n=1 Tax=Rutidosis leptorrhynchoides TaxID=125765 RepID=UPI003A9904AF
MEECYFPAKLKRKDLDEFNDDFCDFSLSSPARKMRRLDAELPPIFEEEEMANPVVFEQPDPTQDSFVMKDSPVAIDELNVSLPLNEERSIVLYDPMNNMPSRSPFSISVNSDFLSGFKNPVLWSNRSQLLKTLNGETEKQDNNSDQNHVNLAVVPWVPTHSQNRALPEEEIARTEVSEMMDTDDVEARIMDIEENNPQPFTINQFGALSGSEGVNHWQQHCTIPQPPHNLSTPIAWSGTFDS